MAEPRKFEKVGVREFREKLATYKEPVEVIHTRGKIKVLGYWYPEESTRPIERKDG